MKALQTVEELRTSLAGLDPVHAGLLWAGVCMLLTTLTNFPSQEEAAERGVDRVAELVARYAIVESLDADVKDGPLLTSYEKSIIVFYQKILDNQVVAAVHFGNSTIRRLGNSVVKAKDFEALLQEVIEKEHACWSVVEVMEIQYQRQREKDIDSRLLALSSETKE